VGWGYWGHPLFHWIAQVFPIGGTPDWATAMIGFSTLGLFSAALGALRQIGEARKARVVQITADFSKQWDGNELLETRQLLRQYEDAEALLTNFIVLSNDRSTDTVLRLLREPDYFEDLAAFSEPPLESISYEYIRRALGDIIVRRWAFWELTLNALRDANEDRDNYPGFRGLAEKLARDDLRS
jgi:hypothetical protein